MKSHRPIAEQLKQRLQRELADPKLNSVKQTYLVEKIKMLGEFLVRKERSDASHGGKFPTKKRDP